MGLEVRGDSMNNWISVKDRLPDPGERVLVSNGKMVMEAYRTIYGNWERFGTRLFCMEPIEWMPMPKGSQDEENEP